MGVAEEPLDFGLTLGRWGAPNGPYLVVPVFGPSNVRDFTGFVTDSVIASTVPPQSIVTDWVYFNPMMYVLYAVDLRRNVNFRYLGLGLAVRVRSRPLPLHQEARTGAAHRHAAAGRVPQNPSPFRPPGDVSSPAPSMSDHAPAGRLLP